MRRFFLCPISLSIAGLVTVAAGQKPGEEKKMPVDFYHSTPQDVRRPAIPPVAIRDGRGVSLPLARETGAAGTYHRFGNTERNSRLSFPIGKVLDRPQWASELPDHITPREILAGSDRVVVNAREGWLLVDGSGKIIHRGYAADGEMTIDAREHVLYAPTDTGYVGAFSLDDGKRRYFVTPFFGDTFRRDFIDRRGERMIIVSIERPRSSHARVPANQSMVEIVDFKQPAEIAESGRLKSAEEGDYLKRKTVRLLAAMHEDMLALGTDDSLSLTNSDLRLEREFTGEFQPLWLSMDELSRSYLIVKAANGQALWVVTQEGERVVKTSLPEGFAPIAPPVVAPDHTAYVVGSDQLMAVDALGAVRWRHREAAGIVGAAVTADGRLLVATGPELVTYGEEGKRERVLAIEGDVFQTAPASGDHGELFIAGRRRLYRIH